MPNHKQDQQTHVPETDAPRGKCGCNGNCRGCPCQAKDRD